MRASSELGQKRRKKRGQREDACVKFFFFFVPAFPLNTKTTEQTGTDLRLQQSRHRRDGRARAPPPAGSEATTRERSERGFRRHCRR